MHIIGHSKVEVHIMFACDVIALFSFDLFAVA